MQVPIKAAAASAVVAAFTILTSVVSLDPLYVYFDVHEQAMLRIKRVYITNDSNCIYIRLDNGSGAFSAFAQQPVFALPACPSIAS